MNFDKEHLDEFYMPQTTSEILFQDPVALDSSSKDTLWNFGEYEVQNTEKQIIFYNCKYIL